MFLVVDAATFDGTSACWLHAKPCAGLPAASAERWAVGNTNISADDNQQ